MASMAESASPDLTSLRQGYGGPPELQRRRKVGPTRRSDRSLRVIPLWRHTCAVLLVALVPGFAYAQDGALRLFPANRAVDVSPDTHLTLTFAAFFLFETLAGLRLHAVHYGLVGAALCLFYLALLALGEVLPPGQAYIGAAVASSLLIICYSVSILRSYARAGTIAALLTGEHGVLYVVLRMEDYALLAGTASLFVVLAGIMFFTRNVDWFAQESGAKATAS